MEWMLRIVNRAEGSEPTPDPDSPEGERWSWDDDIEPFGPDARFAS